MRKISLDLELTIDDLDDRIINVGNFFYKNGSPDVYNNISGSISTLLDSSISLDSIQNIADINNANSNNALLTDDEMKTQFNIKV